MLAQQLAELIEDEGLRLVVYDDRTGKPIGPSVTLKGHPTIGYGRALDVHGISQDEAQALLANDVASVEQTLTRSYTWFRGLDAVRQGVLTNLAINLGTDGLATFRKMLAAVGAGDWETAATELQASRWFRQVQTSRSSRLIEQLRTGTITDGADMSGSFPNLNFGGSVTVTLDPATRALLTGIVGQLFQLHRKVEAMSGTTDTIAAELANLQASVAQAVSVEQSALTLIQGIPALIQAAVDQAVANGATPAQLQAFADLNTQLTAATQPLASAVAAQQPPAPAPAP